MQANFLSCQHHFRNQSDSPVAAVLALLEPLTALSQFAITIPDYFHK
jgi:hypothetical protein